MCDFVGYEVEVPGEVIWSPVGVEPAVLSVVGFHSETVSGTNAPTPAQVPAPRVDLEDPHNSEASPCREGADNPRVHVSGNGGCHHSLPVFNVIVSTHLTQSNPRRPGATSLAGAPCPWLRGSPPTRVASR